MADFPHENDLGPMDAIDSPETMTNLDILDICNRIDVGLREISRCASATRFENKSQDVNRWKGIVSHIRKRFQVQVDVPELDLPKYHPKPLRMPTPPALNRVENNDCQQLLNLLAALRIEMSFSDSHERSTGYKGQDQTRVVELLDKLDKHLEVAESDPTIDVPDVDRQDTGANPNQPALSR